MWGEDSVKLRSAERHRQETECREARDVVVLRPDGECGEARVDGECGEARPDGEHGDAETKMVAGV